MAGMARDGNNDTTVTRSFIDFVLIPSIVCNMVRLLMKDSKRVEALRVCRTFISNHRAVLARYERQKKCPIGMEMAWTFSACVSSVIRVCMDVDEPEMLEDVGLLNKLVAALRHDAGGSKISKMNAKFHLAVGQLLLEARDVLMSLPDGVAAEEAIASEAVLDLMHGVDAATFSTKPSSLTPQNSLSTPKASAMASMASMISSSTAHHEAGMSMENIDLDQMGTAGDALGGDDGLDSSGEGQGELQSQPSHQRSISLHQPMMESAFSSGSVSTNATTDTTIPSVRQAEMSLLDAEAAIDGHAAPLFLLLGGEDDEIDMPWIPTYRPFRSIWSVDPSAPVHPGRRKKILSTITAAANAFFQRCGYFRHAGMLGMQLADDAYAKKDFAASTAILLELAERLEDERWAGIYEEVLLRLARSQLRDGDDGIVGTCHRLLRLHCSKTYASMLLRATELAACSSRFDTVPKESRIRANGEEEVGDVPALPLDPCVCVMTGATDTGGSAMHFVGDSVRVSVRVFNKTGVDIALNGLKALFKIEREEADDEYVADPAGVSITSPHLQHLRNDYPSPGSPSSPFYSSYNYGHGQSPTDAFNVALRRDGASKLATGRALLVGDLASGETTVIIAGSESSKSCQSSEWSSCGLKPEVGQQVDFFINPTVSGTYSLIKLQASINGTHVEIIPDTGLVQLRIEPPEPRIRVDAVTRTLISGEEQWLGLEIDVLRDDSGPPTAMNVEWPPSIRPGISAGIINGEHVDPDDGNVPNTLQYNINQPSLTVWWRARVARTLDLPSEDVRVAWGRHLNPGSNSNGAGPTLQASHHHGANQQPHATPKRMHQLPISVLFEDNQQRCSRVASASASLAVDLPFLFRTEAREVTKGVIVMTVTITSAAADRTVTVHGVELRPQQGFSVLRLGNEPDQNPQAGVNDDRRARGDTLGPLSSMCASFILSLDEHLLENRAVAQATVYRTGKLTPSVASISYSVLKDPEYIVSPSPEANHLPGSSAPDRPSTYVHEHSIALQLSSISSDSSAKNEYVSLRMLGPFSAIIGCPVTLCWQLERVGGPDEPARTGRSTVVSYEVRAEESSWSRCSRSQGTVSLGRKNGSLATVEMAWTPTTIGAVPVPTLRLHDVYYVQEAGLRNTISVRL